MIGIALGTCMAVSCSPLPTKNLLLSAKIESQVRDDKEKSRIDLDKSIDANREQIEKATTRLRETQDRIADAVENGANAETMAILFRSESDLSSRLVGLQRNLEHYLSLRKQYAPLNRWK
jgi:pyruvate/2-oxoglutarate dehydrogenase complex dihydrolipoamide dehydrogenase (E3) component